MSGAWTRLLAFDYGLKRIGIAAGNRLTRTATPLKVLSPGAPPPWTAIDALIDEWRPDLIVVGDRRCDDETLVLPHPRAHERSFVIAPWNDVEPDAEIPGQGPVAELLAKAGTDGILRRDDILLETR